MNTEAPMVYAGINAVQTEMATVGIAKDRHNTQGTGFKFRGIDDVLNTIAPMLARNKLVILPRVLSREVAERQSKNGGALFYVTVNVEYDIVSSLDGSKHTVATFGEAMDSGDKATNKAMSAAYKYMAIQSFAIPIEGDNDTDAHTHEVAARVAKKIPKMDSAELALMLEDLSEADSGEELYERFSTFYKKAKAAGDAGALAKLIDAKDAHPLYAPSSNKPKSVS